MDSWLKDVYRVVKVNDEGEETLLLCYNEREAEAFFKALEPAEGFLIQVFRNYEWLGEK